uniref:Uncharacterized protein n=1 Tax=Meloidogyne enterolobii TaxID=390850 RepID=A0A6V7TMK8_MELEN|nr:unnamed protein product [Meloidogyne enterolobii]
MCFMRLGECRFLVTSNLINIYTTSLNFKPHQKAKQFQNLSKLPLKKGRLQLVP